MTPPAGGRRVVVTGLGIVCALGADQRQVWGAMMEGRSGIGALGLFDATGCLSDRAAEVKRLPDLPGLPAPERARASRSDLLCLAAAREAAAQAGLTRDGMASIGISLGSSTAGMLETEEYVRRGESRGFDRAGVSRILGLPSSAPADAVARDLRAGGPRLSNMTACASSAISIGLAADLIRAGDATGMIAGGGDALCRLTYSGFNTLRLLDSSPCRPFDASRQGLSLGEGAGILVLEEADTARRRGAAVLAEFLDYGLSCDAHHMTAPHPDGRGAASAMTQALERSGITPETIDHVNLHGTGTSLNDATEARALRTVFGQAGRMPSATASKSMIGHLLGGAGAVEAVVLVLTLLHQKIPPTLGWERADEGTSLDLVHGAARREEMRLAISNSFGFGGSNASLVFRRGAA
ncbi:MAG: beta-ketoacyl-[acyl-carrier-protein] synthase family protein [Candidatus Polarisedimenticolia bacterium]